MGGEHGILWFVDVALVPNAMDRELPKLLICTLLDRLI